MGEDLLDHDPRVGCRVAQPLEVAGRIAQAVDVVDAETVDQTVGVQLEHEPMRVIEHLLVLDTKGGQGVDVEEAAVVEFHSTDPPVRQAVVLSLEQYVEAVDVIGDVGQFGVDRAAPTPDRRPGRRPTALPAPPCRAGAFAATPGRRRWRAAARGGRRRDSRAVTTRCGLPPRRSRRRGARREREPVVEVRDDEAVVAFSAHGQLAALEDAPVVVAEDRHQDAVSQAALGRIPVDVEVRRLALA